MEWVLSCGVHRSKTGLESRSPSCKASLDALKNRPKLFFANCVVPLICCFLSCHGFKRFGTNSLD